MPRFEYIPLRAQRRARQTVDRQQCERWAWRRTRPESRGRMRRIVGPTGVVERYLPPRGPEPHALRRALIACMQERGYRVR